MAAYLLIGLFFYSACSSDAVPPETETDKEYSEVPFQGIDFSQVDWGEATSGLDFPDSWAITYGGSNSVDDFMDAYDIEDWMDAGGDTTKSQAFHMELRYQDTVDVIDVDTITYVPHDWWFDRLSGACPAGYTLHARCYDAECVAQAMREIMDGFGSVGDCMDIHIDVGVLGAKVCYRNCS